MSPFLVIMDAQLQHTNLVQYQMMSAEADRINNSIQRTKFFKMGKTSLTIKGRLGYGIGDRDIGSDIPNTQSCSDK